MIGAGAGVWLGRSALAMLACATSAAAGGCIFLVDDAAGAGGGGAGGAASCDAGLVALVEVHQSTSDSTYVDADVSGSMLFVLSSAPGGHRVSAFDLAGAVSSVPAEPVAMASFTSVAAPLYLGALPPVANSIDVVVSNETSNIIRCIYRAPINPQGVPMFSCTDGPAGFYSADSGNSTIAVGRVRAPGVLRTGVDIRAFEFPDQLRDLSYPSESDVPANPLGGLLAGALGGRFLFDNTNSEGSFAFLCAGGQAPENRFDECSTQGDGAFGVTLPLGGPKGLAAVGERIFALGGAGMVSSALRGGTAVPVAALEQVEVLAIGGLANHLVVASASGVRACCVAASDQDGVGAAQITCGDEAQIDAHVFQDAKVLPTEDGRFVVVDSAAGNAAGWSVFLGSLGNAR